MQFGSCLLLLATPEDPLGLRAIPAVREAGYDYAEVPLARLFSLPKEEIPDYRRRFEAVGLPVRVFNNGVPAGLCMISEEEPSRQVREYMDHAVWLARTLGADTITMSGPNKKTTPEEIDWEQVGRPRYIRVLSLYADRCREEGLELLIEPVNEQEQSFIATLAEAESVVRAVRKDNLGIVMDYFHLVKQKDDFQDALRLSSGHILRHVHFADPARRTYPTEENRELCRQVLMDMAAAGYGGRVSVEAFARGELRQTLQTGLTVLREAAG